MLLALLLVVLISVHTKPAILISLLIRWHHVLVTIIIGSSVHVRSEIGTLIIVIGRTSFVVATNILLLLALERLAVVEVSASRIELLRRLKVLRRKRWRCIANWKWLLLTSEWLDLWLLLRLRLRRRLESRRWRREWSTRLELFGQLNCCEWIRINLFHHLLHRVSHLCSIIALNWLLRCCVSSCSWRLSWCKGHRRLLDRHGRCSCDWLCCLKWICCRVHSSLLIYLVDICWHERISGWVHRSWCRWRLKYLSILHQVGLLLSWWLQICRSYLWWRTSYDKYVRGLLLNKVLKEGASHVFQGLLVNSSMERLKLVFLSLFRWNITASFHLLEHTTILVRHSSFVLPISRTVLFLFLAFFIAAMLLNLSTVFLNVSIRRGWRLDLLLYAFSSFLLTFRNWGHV